jgi:hypothetical protein
MTLNMGMNPSQVQIYDPILSNVILGYRSPLLVGNNLFPLVPVASTGGQVLTFGKELFQQYATRRAPGASTTRIDFGYLGEPYALLNNSLEIPVPFENLADAAVVLHLDLSVKAVQLGMDANMLQLEREQAAKAINPALYDASNKNIALSGASLWSAKTTCNPFADIEEAKESITQQCGLSPNTMVLSRSAFKAIRQATSIIERFKYTDATAVTVAKLSALFDIENIVVGKAVSYDLDTDTMSDVWGNNAVVAYVPPGPQNTMMEPSYGYTYYLAGHPLVEQAYQDRNRKSWIYPVTYNRVPVVTGIKSGYLISGVI